MLCVLIIALVELISLQGKPHAINITELPQHNVVQSTGMAVVI